MFWEPFVNNVFGTKLQSELVSKVPFRETAFCSQVPTGIPTWMSLARLEGIGPLPKPVQSKLDSEASLKEAAFCSQVPAGIPT